MDETRGESGGWVMVDATVIKGYELRERIGSGGFGVVHRAFQTTVGREVAIKIILPHFANHPDFIRRFENEAQLIARLEHLHIVPLYDYWRDQHGAYLVMRWLRGGSLKDALQKGPFDLEAAALLLDQIGSALEAAHRNDVIHRDLKPANILFDEDGNAYLADFGIAKNLKPGDGATTDSGIILGSPDYISPEQARNGSVTAQTDIYCFGVVLYEMLAGQHPFPAANSVERLYKHLNEPLPALANLADAIADDVNAVISKATAKNPLHRYADALEMASAFRSAAALQRAQTDESLVKQLTLREHEILQLVVDGCTNQEIAQQLYITVATVKWHVRHLYRKLHVRSRVQAICRARELDLIGADADTHALDSPSTYVVLPEPENPYKGLRAFQTTDARDFFGRETLIQKLVNRMNEHHRLAHFLAVVGPSGSGKSSLVKAGLVPALWRGDIAGSERWFVAEMMPGTRPLDELEIALSRVAADRSEQLREHLDRDANGLLRIAALILPNDGSELVLIIDQFEEVFTLVEDETARTHFLDLIYHAVTDARSRVRVIVTLRADFYDRPLHYPQFGELLRQRMETVLPLSAEELEAAIVKPAARVGVLFEDGLVPTITAEVNYQPGALPLLQYALTELFERRSGRTLTQQAFHEIGGAIGALAQRAEELYQEQDETSKETIRQMFLRLVTLGEGAQDTRRRVHLSELRAITGSPDVMDEMIDTFAAYRLLSLDHDPLTRSPTVEVAHEALLQEWERLREWLNTSRADVRLQRQLAAHAAEWDRAQHDVSYLLRGSRLKQFERWSAETELALTPGERAYLDASVDEHDRQAHLERERQAREARLEHRARRVLQGLVGVFLLAALISAALAVFAFGERATAQQQRDSALRQAAVNRSLMLANDAEGAVANGNTDLGLLLALEAVNMDDPPRNAVRALETVGFAFGARAILRDEGNAIVTVAFSPDSRFALSGGCAQLTGDTCAESELILWDVKNGVERQHFPGPAAWVKEMAFHPDGQTALAAYDDGSIIRWDVQNRQRLHTYRGHSGGVNSVAISPDGRLMASGGADGLVLLWDVESGALLHRFDDHTDAVNRVRFSPDGQLLAAGSDDKLIMVWNAATLERVQRLEGHSSGISAMGFRPGYTGTNTTLISAAGLDLREWDFETGETIRSYQVACTSVALAITPDGRTLAISSCAATALYDLENWQFKQSSEAEAHSDVIALAISPDGRYVLEGQFHGQLQLSNMPNTAEIHRFEAEVPLSSSELSPDGRYLLTGAYSGGIAILWDTQTGEEVRRFENQADSVMTVGFSPDGQQAVIGSADWMGNTKDRQLVLVDINTGQVLHRLEGHEFGVRTHAFSPDGRLLLTGGLMFGAGWNDHEPGDFGELILWDVQTGELIRRFDDRIGVFDIAFSADGQQAYTAHLGPALTKTWDVSTGQETGRFDGFCAVILGYEENTVLADMSLIDLQTNDVIRRFVGDYHGGIMAMGISADGRYLISGDTSGDLILWDYATGEKIRQFPVYTTTIWNAFFSPDGQTAYSSAYEGPVRQWRVADWALEELLAWIHANRRIRDFTCDERAQYDIEPLCE
jgi:WD40 repeat protein/serine/threonine protein kinase/energy-coupling factor transporter ATP-binding protein EcfA2